jgi:hypothetical protein
MTVLAQILDMNEPADAWWADLTAANDDGTCSAAFASRVGAMAGATQCDADDGPRAPAPAWAMRDATQHPTHASALGCPEYAGDLWADVLEYRGIRARILGGVRPTEGERTRLDDLEARLRGESDDPRRLFLRFTCRFAGTLELADGSRHAGVLHDASAGGAKVACQGTAREGDPIVLELATEDLRGSMLLPGRVIWTRPGFIGLMFAGAARWR